MSKCPICDAENPDGKKFCSDCGYSFTGGQTGQLSPDTVLEGRYVIIKTLGRGGMGAVYLALDTRLNNMPIAIKEMSTNAVGTGNLQAAVGSFKKEASILIGLRHPALPIVRDFFAKGEDRWYLVMDYIEGETLKQLVDRRGPIPEAEVLDWARQLGDILSYLHNQNPPIIFRDLKPANIMLTPQGQIKLVDFGIARHFRQGVTADTTAYGSSGFAPIEQYGENQTDARSDIYALGATMHYLLTGIDPIKNPFNFEAPGKFVKVSPRLEIAIMKALELKAENRPNSIQDLLNLLTNKTVRPEIKTTHDPKAETALTSNSGKSIIYQSDHTGDKLPLENKEKTKNETTYLENFPNISSANEARTVPLGELQKENLATEYIQNESERTVNASQIEQQENKTNTSIQERKSRNDGFTISILLSLGLLIFLIGGIPAIQHLQEVQAKASAYESAKNEMVAGNRIDAFKAFKKMNSYEESDSFINKLKPEIYNEGIDFYHKEDYSQASIRFLEIRDYEQSDYYLCLIYNKLPNSLSNEVITLLHNAGYRYVYNTIVKRDITNRMMANIEFEDTKNVILNNFPLEYFLEGSWKSNDGTYYFILTTDANGHMSYNIRPVDGKYYKFEKGICYMGSNEDGWKESFKFQIKSLNEINIYAFKDKTTYVLYRR